MLVLTRKPGERILIGDDVTVTIVRLGDNTVRVGIEAPQSMKIVRDELLQRVPDCLAVREKGSAAFMAPGEAVASRKCCGCGEPVVITELTAAWESDLRRCHRREPNYGCPVCFHDDGTRRNARQGVA